MNTITLLSILSLIFCIILLLPIYKIRKKNYNLDFFEPIWATTFYFLLIFFIRSIFVSIYGSIFLGTPPFEESIVKSWISAIIYLLFSFIFFIIGYLTKLYKIICAKLPYLPSELNFKKTKLILVIIIIIVVGITIYFLDHAGGFMMYLKNRTIFLSSLGSYILFFFYQFLSLSLLIVLVLMQKGTIKKFFVILFMLLILLAGFIIGSKFLFVLPIVSILSFYNYNITRIKLKTIFFIFLILFILIPIFYIYRFSKDMPTFFISLRIIFNNFIALIKLMLSRFHGMDMLVYAIKYTPYLLDFQMGKTILPVLFGWIPRLIWTDKPIISFSEVFTKKYLERFSSYYPSGSVAAVTLIGESYINFHFIGILLISLFIGILLRIMYEYLINKVSNISGYLIYSFLFIYLVTIWESTFASFFSKFFLTAILSFLIIILSGEYEKKIQQ